MTFRLLCCAALAGSCAASHATPERAAEVAAAQAPGGVAVAWCAGSAAGSPEMAWHAVAVAHGAGGGGTYVVHHAGKLTPVGTFLGRPELQCLSTADARQLNRSIKQSEGIDGEVKFPGSGSVVCVFVEPTRANCWQYSQRARSFVLAGGWVT